MTDDLPPQVEEAIDAYVDESYAKNVIVLPLRKPSDPDEAERGGRNAEMIGEVHVEREIIGALIVEQIETDLPREILEPRIDLVYEHSTRALSNAIDYHSMFLMPLWRTIGKSTVLVKGRNLPKTLTIGGAHSGRCCQPVPDPHRFQSEGRRCLAAGRPPRCLLRRGRHHHGRLRARVTSWSRRAINCCELENHDLEQEWQKIIGQISETTERLDSLRQARSGQLEL